MIMNAARRTAFCVLAFLCSAPAFAQSVKKNSDRPQDLDKRKPISNNPIDLRKPIPNDPALRHGKLKNGFTYYLRPTNNPGGKVHIEMITRAGSEHEAKDQLGLAHLLEHVLCRGSKSIPDVKKHLDANGMMFGRDFNAGTGFKQTTYFVNVDGNNKALVDAYLGMVQDWAFGRALMDTANVNPERDVVLQESAFSHSPDMVRNFRIMLTVAKDYTAYRGSHSETSRNIRTFAQSSVERFYHDFYRPEMEGVMVVGNFDPDSMMQKIEQLFSGPYREGIPYPNIDFKPARLNGSNDEVILFDEVQEPRCEIVLKQPYRSKSYKNYGEFKDALIAELAASMMVRRIAELSESLGDTVKTMTAQHIPLYNYGDAFAALAVRFSAEQAHLQKVFTYAMEELYRIKRDGFTAEELDAALKAVRYNRLQKQDLMTTIPTNYVENFVEGSVMPDPETWRKTTEIILQGITLKSVNESLRDFTPDKNRIIVMMAPEKDSAAFPREETIAAWAKASAKLPATYVRRPKPKEQFPPVMAEADISRLKSRSADNLHQEVVSALDVREVMLPNGIRVLLKPLPETAGKIHVKTLVPVQPPKSRQDSLYASFLLQMVLNRPMKPYNDSIWHKFINHNNLSFHQFFLKDQITSMGDIDPRNMEILFQVIHQAFQRPTIDQAAFDAAREKWRNRWEKPSVAPTPQQDYQQAVEKELTDYMKFNPTLAEIDGLNLDLAIKMQQQLMPNKAGLTFVVVGPYDSAYTMELLSTYISTIQVEKGPASGQPAATEQMRKVLTFHKDDITDDGSAVQLHFKGVPGLSPEVRVQMELLKMEYAKLLVARLRAKESISYGPSATLTKWSRDGKSNYLLGAYFDCIGSRTDDGIRYAIEEFKKLRDPATHAIFLEGVKQLMKYDLAHNNFAYPTNWVDYIADVVKERRSLDDVVNAVKIIDKTTAADLIRLAESFDVENYILLSLRAKEE